MGAPLWVHSGHDQGAGGEKEPPKVPEPSHQPVTEGGSPDNQRNQVPVGWGCNQRTSCEWETCTETAAQSAVYRMGFIGDGDSAYR